MKRISILLIALGMCAGLPLATQADPKSDLAQFQDFFKKKFPTVKLDDFAHGLYTLPGNEEYRDQWNIINEFPPYELGLVDGRKIWETPFANGKTFASCFKNGGKNIAQGYPYWDDAKQEIRTAEMDLMDCAKKNGAELKFLTADLGKDQKARVALAELTAHFYSLSKGQRIRPDVDFTKPGALKAYEEGKKYWWSRRGQLHFACANCHMDLAGKNFGGNQPLSAALGHTTAWPAQRIEWARIETIHQRYITCNSQVRAKPQKHGSKDYNHLQLYETYMSSGLPLTAPAMRN
jgi:sulfur-oxidizing protein SoxA